MATYILLGNLTDQGIRAVKDTVKRGKALDGIGQQLGVTVQSVYWTWGQYDVAVIVEAPDEASVSAFVVSVCALGNVRYQTLRAFSDQEMDEILGRMV